MTAPYPHEGQAGRHQPERMARQLFEDYVWLARWSNEIGNDAALDLKKLVQLAIVHCQSFRAVIDNYTPIASSPEFVQAVEDRFSAGGSTWPDVATMRADLTALYQECGALFVFVRDNVPELANGYATLTWDAINGFVEVPITAPKPHIAVPEVAKVRVLFGAVPS